MPEAQPLWPQGLFTPDGRPTITYFPAPREIASGASFVVLPGGGYACTAPHEADPVALWFNSLGIAAFVVHYRVTPHTKIWAPLQDAARAIRQARANSEALSLDPSRIGILGFSAGGHLAGSISNHYDAGDPASADPVERVSSRPDLSVLIYPVISFSAPFTHVGSRENLIGTDPEPSLIEKFSLELQVTPNTPPTFLIHSADDDGVPLDNSLSYASALYKAKVPLEMHVYEVGGHGYGMAENHPTLGVWPELCAKWLSGHGF